MKRWRRRIGILLIVTAFFVMQLPVGRVEAADSTFSTSGSAVTAYLGKEKTVTVPANITEIGTSAFEDNDYLEKIVLPKSLRRIKPYAFWGCDSLKEIQFGSGLKEIGDYAFANCQGLTTVQVPSNITSIGLRAFADCVNLTTIVLPETVSYIHETAFDGCKKLVIQCTEGSYADKYARDFYRRQAQMEDYEDAQDVTPDETEPQETPSSQSQETDDTGLLGSTNVVGNHAVVLLDNRTVTVYQGDITDTQEEGTPEGGITYPVKYRIVGDSLIADKAYYKNKTLREIVLPEGIVEVGEFAFARSAAESAYLPEGVEKLDYGAFYHCDFLSDVTLPESIRKVEPQCFQYTALLSDFLADGTGGEGDFLIRGGVLLGYRGASSEVAIPEGVRVIAAECFQNHAEIKAISMPESMTDIGEAAFEGCSSLSDLTWKNGIQTIGDRAFAGCPLKEVSLPGTLKELGIGAFRNDTAISSLGKQTQRTHESSAERLSNESYRFMETDGSQGLAQGGSVLVVGMTGARATLSGAQRPYTLKLSKAEDAESRQKAGNALTRNIGSTLSADDMILHMELTDESEITINRLGKQVLTLSIPISDNLEGQELKVYRYDRNGQLEPQDVRFVSMDGELFAVVETTQVFDLVLCGTGNLLSQDRIEEAEKVLENAAGTAKEGGVQTGAREMTPLLIFKWSLGGFLLLAGLFLALSKVK